MSFFKVIIPTHKNEDTLKWAVWSVLRQTFTDYELYVVSDDPEYGSGSVMGYALQGLPDSCLSVDIMGADTEMSADGSRRPVQRFSGGSRNRAIFNGAESEYTLFLDGDDDFTDAVAFQELYDFIVDNAFPDMVRLPYIRHNTDKTTVDQTPNLLREKTIDGVAKSCRVACWTKAVKSKLVQRFPENTLCEDVCQHLKQCDVTETVAWFPRAIVNWRIRPDSTSNGCSPKWKSSCYRFVADLMDLELEKPYTRARRDVKLAEAIQNLREGRWQQ